FADASVDVVSAGEILEHVTDPSTVVREACRILRPGGTLVLDTINDTWAARFVAVTLAERVAGLAPRGIHDPAFFVRPRVMVNAAAQYGVPLPVRGVGPAPLPLIRWLVLRRGSVPIVATGTAAVLYQAWGVKE